MPFIILTAKMPVFVFIEEMQMKECLFLEQIKRTIKSLWYSKLFIMDQHLTPYVAMHILPGTNLCLLTFS